MWAASAYRDRMNNRHLRLVEPDEEPEQQELDDLDEVLGSAPQELIHETPRD